MKLILLFYISILSLQLYSQEYDIVEKIQQDSIITDHFSFNSISMSKIELSDIGKNTGLVFRKKFAPNSYSFYYADLSKEYLQNVYPFRIPFSMDMNFFLKKKLFIQESLNLNDDISNVYFDNDFIYLSGVSRLYYFDAGWKVLRKTKVNVDGIKLLSEPDGATVMVNTKIVGKTPFELGNFQEKYLTAKFLKDGYYQYQIFIENGQENLEIKKVLLTKKVEAPVGTYISPDAFCMESVESFNRVVSALKKERVKLYLLVENMRNSIVNYEKRYPAMPVQNEFEPDTLYQKRRSLYVRIRDNGKFHLSIKNSAEIYEQERTIIFLESELQKIYHREYVTYLLGDKLKVNKYRNDIFAFEVTQCNVGLNPEIIINGRLYMSPQTAKDYRVNIKNSLLKLTYKNVIKDDGKFGDVRFCGYRYTKFSVLFNGSEYPVVLAKNHGVALLDSDTKERGK